MQTCMSKIDTEVFNASTQTDSNTCCEVQCDSFLEIDTAPILLNLVL